MKNTNHFSNWLNVTLALAIAFLIFGVQASQAQILQPVKWQYAFKKTSDKEGVLMVRATIDHGWHIYGLQVPKDGPERTEIRLEPSKSYKPIGAVQEPEPLSKYEETFKMDVPYFVGAVIFQQKVQLNEPKTTIRGSIKYMVCDETRCLPVEILDFAVKVE